MTIELKKVRSKQIAAIGYDAATKTLAVRFNSGSVYHYDGVEPDMHASLLKASSIGGFFHRHVRGFHKYTRIESPK